MKIITPDRLKPGDKFRFANERINVYVFTGIRKNYTVPGGTNVMYAEQVEPIQLWCWWDLSVDDAFSRIVILE